MNTVNYGVARQMRDELTNHRENCRAAEALTVERDLLRYAISAYRENADDAEAIASIASGGAVKCGAKPRAPWETRVSRRAGLPVDRAAWLAVVLPVIHACDSSPAVEAALAAKGHVVNRGSAQKWHRWLTSAHAAGSLPEAPQGLPVRVAARRFGTPQAPAVTPRKGPDVVAAANAARIAAAELRRAEETKRVKRHREKIARAKTASA